MKIFFDTNFLVSAILNPTGTVAKAFEKAVSASNTIVISDQNLDELFRIFNRKFPNRLPYLKIFLSEVLPGLTIVRVPEEKNALENLIRDEKDRPLLRAALAEEVDVFLTGDKDFLESGITKPLMIKPAQFLEMLRDKKDLQ